MIMIVAGTRPEYIKLVPIVQELRLRKMDNLFVATGQHELASELWPNAPVPDVHLEGPARGTSLERQYIHICGKLSRLMAYYKPRMVMVQGDTTSVLAGAQTAFMMKIPVIHVEAGLRSGNINDPYPEEAYRQLVSRIAVLNCAPTLRAYIYLQQELVPGKVVLTGNTITDALRLALPYQKWPEMIDLPKNKMILATCHRRENWGKGAENLLQLLLQLVLIPCRSLDEVYVVVHPNPLASEPFLKCKHPRIKVIPALPYTSMLALLNRADVIITDSGGLMEEAVTLGKQVCIYRKTTERYEAVDKNAAYFNESLQEISEVMFDMLEGKEICKKCKNVFGDGHAAEKIINGIIEL